MNDDLCPLCQTTVTIPYTTEPLVAGSVSPSGMQGDLYIAEVFQETVARNWDVAGDGLTQCGSGFRTCTEQVGL